MPNPSGESNKAALRKKKMVLVADDNEAAAEVLVEALRFLGFEACAVYRSTQVVELALQYMPDWIFLDIGMPYIDGYELARQLRGKSVLKGTKLVAITGYGSGGDRQKAYEAGFDAHIVKPVGIAELEDLLK